MYTGYFSKLSVYESKGLIPISICGKAPKWYSGLQYKKLAPKWSFFHEWKYGNKHKGDNEYYVDHFNNEVLKLLSVNSVIKELESLTGVSSDKIILLCYEKPGDFCHRHLVSEWMRSNNLFCKEF